MDFTITLKTFPIFVTKCTVSCGILQAFFKGQNNLLYCDVLQCLSFGGSDAHGLQHTTSHGNTLPCIVMHCVRKKVSRPFLCPFLYFGSQFKTNGLALHSAG